MVPYTGKQKFEFLSIVPTEGPTASPATFGVPIHTTIVFSLTNVDKISSIDFLEK